MEDIGKIYKISGYGLNYYGSTIETLNRRLKRHLKHFKDFNENKRTDKTTAFQIFEKGDDYKIELIEHILYKNIKELLDRENHYITNNECVNKNIPQITPLQKKERQKKYNDKHKEQIKETAKKWAEKDRREKGCKIKVEMTLTKEPDYSAKKARERRAKETPEQKEIRLQKRREQYKNKELTDEQKEKAKERAKKQREMIKNNPEKAEELKQYKTEKAREYRGKLANNDKKNNN